MLKAIKIRLYPSNDQQIYANKLIGSSRFVYNQSLDFTIKQYEEYNESVSISNMGKFLTNLKKHEDYPWLKESHSKVLQQSIMNLNQAFINFFRDNGAGFPKFKAKHFSKQSCRFPKDAIMGVKGNRINIITQLMNIHYKCSRDDEKYLNKHQELIKSGTLNKSKSGNYYFSILIDRPNKKLKNPVNNIIGIDLGIKDFIVDSNGNKFKNIKIKRNNENQLARLHCELSRKKKGGTNREKSRIKLARFYEKLNNKKEYYLHSVANQLINENQIISMENLNVKGMLKNHKLARSIQELSLCKFKEILKYKVNWYDREVIEVDQWFPSSKLCNICGYKNKELKLSDRLWICPSCNSLLDRDLNAAINIRNEGIRIKIGMSLPELTPLESKSLDPQRIRNQKIEPKMKVI